MISIIAAIDNNNCIGKDNKIPWIIKEDLKRFKKITLNQIVLMGRKTYDSIFHYLGSPLPDRRNIVVTRNKKFAADKNVEIYNSVNEVLKKYTNDNIFIIGGADIYRQTIDKADKLYITRVNQYTDGDAFFPVIDKKKWHMKFKKTHSRYSFEEYTKK